jgi:hypothetical protein
MYKCTPNATHASELISHMPGWNVPQLSDVQAKFKEFRPYSDDDEQIRKMLGTLYDNNVQKAKDPVVSSNKAAGETVVQHRMRQHLYNEFSIEKSNGGGNTFHQGQEWA